MCTREVQYDPIVAAAGIQGAAFAGLSCTKKETYLAQVLMCIQHVPSGSCKGLNVVRG